MDWKNLFFSADGRIGRQDFWIGFLILLGVNVVLGWIPLFGQVLWLATLWCWVCLYSKRLHDMGKSGWLVMVPFVVMIGALVAAAIVGGAGVVSAVMSGAAESGDPADAAGLLAGMGAAVGILGLSGLFGLCFLLWTGLSASQPGENRFGAPKGQAAPAIA